MRLGYLPLSRRRRHCGDKQAYHPLLVQTIRQGNLMNISEISDNIRVAVSRRAEFRQLARRSGRFGGFLIQAVFFSDALAAWIGLPGHEKASQLFVSVRQLNSSFSFQLPAFQECVLGLAIATILAALTLVILSVAGIASYQNGDPLLLSGWAMWYAARVLHSTPN